MISAALRSEAASMRAETSPSPAFDSRPGTDVTLAADTGVVQIPYSDINRSHLVEE
jgi:hypothetical protein